MSKIDSPPGIITKGQVGFGGVNADALQGEWAINFATISVCNNATKAQEVTLQAYNNKMSNINNLINAVNAAIPSDTSGKDKYYPLPQGAVEAIKALGIAMPTPHSGKKSSDDGYSVSQLNTIVSSLNNKLSEVNTDSQGAAQNASSLTNYVNTAATSMSSLIAAMSQAMTYSSAN